MRKIKIRLPATLTHFGTSLDIMGLAIGLYAQVDLTLRDDDKIVISSADTSKKQKKKTEHPVATGISQFFKHIGKPVIGVNVSIITDIPSNCGLGDDTAFMVAGVLGANILAGNVYTRQDLIPILSTIVPNTDGAIASLMGGLASSLAIDDVIHFRTLPISPFRMLIAVPEIEKFKLNGFPDRVRYDDMRHNIRHSVMLQHALATGDMNLLAQTLSDPICQPLIQAGNPMFSDIRDFALQSGAVAVATTGKSYAMVFFVVEEQLAELQSRLQTYFENNDQPTRVVPAKVDTQGVIISAMQST